MARRPDRLHLTLNDTPDLEHVVFAVRAEHSLALRHVSEQRPVEPRDLRDRHVGLA